MLHSMLDLLSKDSLVMWLNYYGNQCLNVKYKVIHHNGYEVIRKICDGKEVSEHRLSTSKGQLLFTEYQENKRACELYEEGRKLWKKRYSEEIPLPDIDIIKERNPYRSDKFFEALKPTGEASYGTDFKTKLGMTVAQKVIISVLEQNNLPFKYQPTITVDGITRYADFVICVPWLYSCFPLEHFETGRVGNSRKSDSRCSVTINRYINEGMIPGIDFLITSNGNKRRFDAELFEKVLANFINQMSGIIMAEYNSGK